MSEQHVNQIYQGMHVEDADGDAIGTVDAIYQPMRVVASTSSGAAQAADTYLKVHAGLPLLGKTLYIPAGAIRDVTADRIILRIDENDLDKQGWEERPAWIKE